MRKNPELIVLGLIVLCAGVLLFKNLTRNTIDSETVIFQEEDQYGEYRLVVAKGTTGDVIAGAKPKCRFEIDSDYDTTVELHHDHFLKETTAYIGIDRDDGKIAIHYQLPNKVKFRGINVFPVVKDFRAS